MVTRRFFTPKLLQISKRVEFGSFILIIVHSNYTERLGASSTELSAPTSTSRIILKPLAQAPASTEYTEVSHTTAPRISGEFDLAYFPS